MATKTRSKKPVTKRGAKPGGEPRPPGPAKRQEALMRCRNLKMARSAHAYVRGNTRKFYEWLEAKQPHTLPEGPAIWICGDCHVGNLGPIADIQGRVDIQIRDLDQTVIGNPAHDLIRLALSLATAARGSDLPGVITARMLESLMVGYESAFDNPDAAAGLTSRRPAAVRTVMRQALGRRWKHLAHERLQDTTPSIPLGKRFWRLAADERRAIGALFERREIAHLATLLTSRDAGARVEVMDAAYWVKGCSSLGRLRFAALLSVGSNDSLNPEICLIDIKEAVNAAAPGYPKVNMPRGNGERVVEGARHLSPALGDRILSAQLLDKAVFIRELLPQDLKLAIDTLRQEEASRVARYLGEVVGNAHARQMDLATQRSWLGELARNRSRQLDAPSWLWTSVLDLIASHEVGYLEHCRKFALGPEAHI
ncbi:DUF2252 family protein [Cupriavidus basilensis]|uniref:DUF2252 family protein n=1 Tax=Cupriavidus basilensis TaxID=68895 RepID=UPI00157BA018|nr:DUF2252 family protein [Cupriavidus basilensis]NUA25522.1 DUF2252 domain-containing protein [Cupriavidus basilensis]